MKKSELKAIMAEIRSLSDSDPAGALVRFEQQIQAYATALSHCRHMSSRHNNMPLPPEPEPLEGAVPPAPPCDTRTLKQARKVFGQSNPYALRIFARVDRKMSHA